MGEAFSLLKEYSKLRRIDTQLVFPNSDSKTTTPMNIRGAFERAVIAAKIDNFHFHDLRHTCASYLAMNGAIHNNLVNKEQFKLENLELI
jgi:integrase